MAKQSTAVAEVTDEGLEGNVVVEPDLVFTTPKKERPAETEEARRIPFELDGETYTAIRPVKLEETLLMLVEAGARRATTADTLWAGAEFFRRVLAPESLVRLQKRLDDDDDPFEITDLYGILERIVRKLSADASKSGTRPARARARR